MYTRIGRKIDSIDFPTIGNEPCSIRSTEEHQLRWQVEEINDTEAQAWVVGMRGDVETDRYNPRYLEAIHWSVEPPTT